MFIVKNYVNLMYVNCYMGEIKIYSILKHLEVQGHMYTLSLSNNQWVH